MSFSTYRYLLMTTDPVHIGTGGMRLGRVDNSIVREPGTRLPKIPGTSLSGAIRSYAAHRYGKRECAGQGVEKDGRNGHCGQSTCPICYTFGSVKGDSAFSGVVSIGDARLLLFPVYSMVGPVWVTSPSILRDFGIEDQSVDDNKAKWNGITNQRHLNLGWLMVEKDGGDWTVPEGLPDPACSRIVLISDKLFSQVVNSNLEVRTSVAINPETGASEDGALFTYEAIPRATFLWMDVVVDDFRGKFPATTKKYDKNKGDNGDNQGLDLGLSWNNPDDVINAALEWANHLGIGGMGTRGFGRVHKISCKQIHPVELPKGN